MRQRVCLGIGANLGNPVITIFQAMNELKRLPGVENVHCSPLYSTPPVSPIPQPCYVNGVCTFSTTLSPFALLEALQKIERMLGKFPKPKESPRYLDLDILLYGDVHIHTDLLQIPHPRWMERAFVLIPFADIQESVFVPGVGMVKIPELLKNLPSGSREGIQLIERVS